MLFKEGKFVDYIEESGIGPGQYYPVVSLQNSGHEVRFTSVQNPKKISIPNAKERNRLRVMRGNSRGGFGGGRGGFGAFGRMNGFDGEEE